MDATRPRRLRDSARQGWYARWRCFRFARHLGFPSTTAIAPRPEDVPLPPNDPRHQAQDQAEQQASHQREVEAKILPLDAEVARRAA